MPLTRVSEALENGNARRLALAVLVAVAVLTFLISRVGVEELKSALSRVSVATALFVFLMVLAMSVLRACRFRILLAAFAPPLAPLTMVVLVCNLAVNVLPARTGDFAYPALFRRYFDVPLLTGLPVLLLARILDLCAVCLVFAAAALSTPADVRSAYPFLYPAALTVLGVALGLVLGLLFAARCEALAERAVVAASRWAARRSARAGRIVAKAMQVLAATRTLSSPPAFGLLLASSLGIWVCAYLAGFAVLANLNVDVSLALAFVAQALTLVVTVLLPLNAVGQFGTFEGTWTMALVLFGVPERLAIVSGITLHLVQFSCQVLLGATSLALLERVRPTRLPRPKGEGGLPVVALAPENEGSSSLRA